MSTKSDRLLNKIEAEHRELTQIVGAFNAHGVSAEESKTERKELAERNVDVANPNASELVVYYGFIVVMVLAIVVDGYALSPFAAWVAAEMQLASWYKWIVLFICTSLVSVSAFAVRHGRHKAHEEFNAGSAALWNVAGVAVSAATPIAVFIGAAADAYIHHQPLQSAVLVQPYVFIPALCACVLTLALIFISDTADDALAHLGWKLKDRRLAQRERAHRRAAERLEQEGLLHYARLEKLKAMYGGTPTAEPPFPNSVRNFVRERFDDDDKDPPAPVTAFSGR